MKLDEIDLCNLSVFETGCPYQAFKTLRDESPVFYQKPTLHTPDGEGFWVITKNDDARAILKNHQVFSSETGKGARTGGGTTLVDMSTEMAAGQVLSMMDPPKHDAIRGLVSQGFFPKTLKKLEAQMRELAREIVQALPDSGEVDFLNQVAAQLPLQVICTMAGLPREDWHKMLEWADAAIVYGAHDPEVDTAPLVEKLTEMGIYAFELIQKLKVCPGDTFLFAVVHAEIPGEDGVPRKLDEIETIRFFNLLITGGTETTRNAIAGGFYLLLTHPEQYQLLANNQQQLMDNAIDEILRWTSPVHFNRRTASEDIDYKGKKIKRGEKVTVWYPSANRDEELFDQPDVFDIKRRNASKHLAFGHGIHHCIGSALARMEIRVILEELFKKYAGKKLSPIGELRYIRSNRHQGVAEMRICIK